MNQPPPCPRFQFRLRTLLIVVTAFCVLVAQSPLIEWHPPKTTTIEFGTDQQKTVRRDTLEEGYYFVPDRVYTVAGIELAGLLGWILFRIFHRRWATLRIQ